MRHLLVVGIGPGDPEHLTFHAATAIGRADVVFALDKGDDRADLARVRQELLDRHGAPGHRVVAATDPPRVLGRSSYDADVAAWHDQRVDVCAGFVEALADGETGAFLVWGDPALYDSTLRILDRLRDRGGPAFDVTVVPGISAPQLLAARFGIALHAVGAPVHVTTGRRLRQGWPSGVDDVVVVLDGGCAFTTVEAQGVTIFWGAYLGTPGEILVSGPLAEVSGEIVRVRAEAREHRGWMFDTYLLRRR
ncbi:MAG TPA: precorrin-6A synthase (deacetylating) [Acidimicrobiales bacterium]|nr:precorrin-6A synthase (deacetylating) [Acidimicrobiales bacterium]